METVIVKTAQQFRVATTGKTVKVQAPALVGDLMVTYLKVSREYIIRMLMSEDWQYEINMTVYPSNVFINNIERKGKKDEA